jgi:hypothetical protein
MKLLKLCWLLIFILCLHITLYSQTADTTKIYGIVTEFSDVYSAAIKANSLFNLLSGTRIRLFSKRMDFFQIKYKGIYGYIPMEKVKVNPELLKYIPETEYKSFTLIQNIKRKNDFNDFRSIKFGSKMDEVIKYFKSLNNQFSPQMTNTVDYNLMEFNDIIFDITSKISLLFMKNVFVKVTIEIPEKSFSGSHGRIWNDIYSLLSGKYSIANILCIEEYEEMAIYNYKSITVTAKYDLGKKCYLIYYESPLMDKYKSVDKNKL